MRSGSSNGPAGIRDLMPMTAPPTANASVPRSGPAARAETSRSHRRRAPRGRPRRATIDATSPTQATRRYCMTATSLMSPPKASAISTMAVAAPGEEPQTAVVPGNTLKRARTKPRAAAKNMTAPIKVRNIGHFRTIVVRMSGVMLRATRQPTKPCAMTKAQEGILTRPSNHDSRIPAAIAPSIKAAGRRTSSKAATQMSDATRSTPHCRAGGLACRVISDIASSGAGKASASLSVTRAIRGKIRRIDPCAARSPCWSSRPARSPVRSRAPRPAARWIRRRTGWRRRRGRSCLLRSRSSRSSSGRKMRPRSSW